MPAIRFDRSFIALTLGFIALVATVMVAIILFRQEQAAQRWVVHTLEVQDRISRIFTLEQDAETGARGYALTGNGDFLEPYRHVEQRLMADTAGLIGQVADNPVQLARARKLRELSLARLAEAKAVVELTARHDARGAVARIASGRGDHLMDQSRALVAEMLAYERALLVKRIEVARGQSSGLALALGFGALLVIGLGLYSMVVARRQIRVITIARDVLADTNAELVAEARAREEAQAQVRQMQKMESIGQLTGGIAHDFNNMLAIVIGSLDMALRKLATDPDRARTLIGNAMEGADRAAQLTARLLAYSRQQPLSPRALDLNKQVSSMSELLRRTLPEHVRVETVLAGGLWSAFVDAPQLENAILNLCVNARDAMPDGGKLTIETANSHLDDAYAAAHHEVKAGQYVMVSVTDSGTGMPVEVMERAFDPFFTTKGVGKGTGLGLSQVYGFVKQTGGHVKIYSEIGVGTTIKLYLPRHFGEAAEVARAPDTLELPRARDEEIILVAEDEQRVRHLSVDTLRELGYVVVQATDANQALEQLRVQPRIDLLFTDIVMPDMNGRQLADRARKSLPGLKVLYTTGYTRNAIVHNGMLDHDVAFLAKPFTVEQLARKVREVLDEAPTVIAEGEGQGA